MMATISSSLFAIGQLGRQSSFYFLASIVLAFGFQNVRASDFVIDFEEVEVGRPKPSWTEKGVRFELAHPPKKSKAEGRISFFPHLGTGRKGIVNAMAAEAIPIRVTFEKAAKKVTLKMWGSTTSSAYVEAFDRDGKSIAKKELDRVPVRKTPEEPVPFFEMEVEAPNIVCLEIGGSKPGGFVAIDELHWTVDETN